MHLKHATVGPWAMNAYALVCDRTRQSVLIDPGADPHLLQGLLAGTTPIAILVTHDHPDHIGALEEMRRHLQVPVMAHGRCRFQTDRALKSGDTIEVGEHRMDVFATPGHTDNQLCFGVQDSHIHIVGDTVFEGGPGKTWSWQDFQTTLTILRRVVLAWPDAAVCHPGHGRPFRLGDVRAAIEGFLAKDHGRFYGDATWDM